LRYSPLYEKPDPSLECKNCKCQPTYRKTQVSVVADMRFRGVASLNQVGHNFGVGEQKKRDPKGRQQGIVGEGAASLPPHQLRCLGSAVSSPSGVQAKAPAAESFSCILCHQIASSGTSVYSCSCVLNCLCLYDCNTFHDTPYIHLGAPYILGWHGPWGSDAPDEIMYI